MNYKKVSQFKSFNKTQAIFGVIVLLFLFLGWALYKEIKRSQKINAEIALLQNQIQELEKGNVEQQNLVEHLKTDFYFEEQARLKLGLKKPGETVVYLNPTVANEVVTSNQPIKNSDQDFSNPRRWFNYFFGWSQRRELNS